MPFEILQVTAAYSNAVLAAIMPHVSDFSKTLELPLPQPITISQVARFGCSPRADHVGGRVVLTNDYSFSFDQGIVILYRSPFSYYSLQDPDRISEFFGPVKLKSADAARIAHLALNKLGYTDAALHLDHPPKITPPPSSQGKKVARYLVEWLDPDHPTPPNGFPSERVAVEVDAATGQIQMLGLQNKNVRRPDPQVSVQAPVLSIQPKSQPIGGRKLEQVDDAYARALLVAILPEFSEFVKKSGVDVKIPITTNDVDMPHYYCGFIKNDPTAFVYLKAGDRFVYQHGHISDFETHDAYRIPEPNKPFEDKPPEKFFGPVRATPDEAWALVSKVMKQLGYEEKIPQLRKCPEIVPPAKYGTNYFARYFFNWWPEDHSMQIAVAEVDATSTKLKALYINDRIDAKLWREPPTISVGEHAARSKVDWLFGGVTNLAIIQSPSSILAYRILPEPIQGKTNKKTVVGHPIVSGPVTVSPAKADALRKTLLAESCYSSAVYKCEFSPGLVLSFIRGDDRMDLVVCLTCNEIRVLKNNAYVADTFYDPAAANLLEIAKQIFPKDKQLQKIKTAKTEK